MSKLLLLDVDGVLNEQLEVFDRGKDSGYTFAGAAAGCREFPSLPFHQAKAIARQSYKNTGSELTAFYEMGGNREKLFRNFHAEAFELLGHYIQAPDGLREAFQRVNAQTTIALVGHANQEWIEKVLKAVDISDEIDPGLIFSLEHPLVNFRRKDAGPEIYHTICRALGHKPEKSWTADDTDANLLQAKKAGLTTTWIKASAGGILLPHTDEVQPDVVKFLNNYPVAKLAA